ncbi:Tripartite tricarboxylate transporter family receptor [Pigmentiphaga humi]|uniref:Tripartite tricarboxylate transporter family receptor n=1 Tax=Pigmentiphaga humi TaxID=2478468 RepID=A0A3P4B3J6_9BURK|nr:tripartite tricarboxylate transporter substrate binding protein [Pigmentiphaga humi]VCU70874.1 Tripartite tricarboxylate transporter family receptor [Pigmentiphaga humi]
MIRIHRRTALRSALAFGLACAAAGHAQAAETGYPNRPIKLVVPYTAGGSNDVVARVLGQKLSSYWSQPVVVENRPGAGGNLGAAHVARAEPDGYTLLITPNNLLTMNPALYRKTGAGYDPVKDFTPISLVASGPIMLATNAGLPVKSVRELIAYAKANPDKLSYASAGSGTPHHLTAELFKSMTGIQMVHVPYRGAAPAVTDLSAGRVQVMFGIPNSLMPFVKTGQLRALAVSGKREMIGLPTVADSGVPGFDSELWIGLTAPAGTPAPVIQKLNEAIEKAMRDPEVASALDAQGLAPAWSSTGEFAALVRKDSQRWTQLIDELGLSAD